MSDLPSSTQSAGPAAGYDVSTQDMRRSVITVALALAGCEDRVVILPPDGSDGAIIDDGRPPHYVRRTHQCGWVGPQWFEVEVGTADPIAMRPVQATRWRARSGGRHGG